MKDRTRIVFLGTSAFAVPSLKALAADPAFDVQLVITQPDKPAGRKQELTGPPVKVAAMELAIPVQQPENINAVPVTTYPLSGRPDILVVVSYGQILKEDILAWPKVAPVNVHASLLPLLRGASPLQHSILLGFGESGVTVQRIVKELDAGPVLAQEKITLDSRETFTTLHDKLASIGAALLVQTLKNPLREAEQDHTKKTVCKKLSKEDGIADPKTMTAEKIDRMVRALTPWPGVQWNGCKILGTTLQENVHGFPLPCADGTLLYVTQIQPAGGRPMDGASFLRGRPDALR